MRLDLIGMIKFLDRRDGNLLICRYHFMFEIPACATSELGNNDIAVAEKVDIEIDMENGLEDQLADIPGLQSDNTYIS